MTESVFLYTFIGLMLFNLLVSVIYLTGMEPLRVAFKKAFQPQKPR